MDGTATVHFVKPNPIVVRQVSYKNLVDSPSPRSKLGDRVIRLKQKCIAALGEQVFQEAYDYLKQYSIDHSNVNNDSVSIFFYFNCYYSLFFFLFFFLDLT